MGFLQQDVNKKILPDWLYENENLQIAFDFYKTLTK